MTYINPDREFLLRHIKYDKRIVRAKGHYLYDDDGRAYLDCLSQYGAVPFGHNPALLWSVIKAVNENDGPSLVQPFLSVAAEELARELLAASPIKSGYVTFANSGAETVEAAIKLARAKTQRHTILSTLHGFHGKTLGAVSATGNEIYRKPFLTDARFFEHVRYGDVEALSERLACGDVAAFLVEPLQGEAGMITPPPGYLSAAADICRKAGTLLVLDEVQTGLGRTGRLFAAEHENVNPDVILLAKALGGGLLSLGACLCSEEAWTSDFGTYHSSTFANNHLACSVGLATLRRLQERDQELVKRVNDTGSYLRKGLERLVQKYGNVFVSVDGQGLMQGLVLAPWNNYDSYFMTHASDTGLAVPLVCGHLFHEHGVLTAPTFNSRNVLRLQPSLTIETFEVDRLLGALDETARTLCDGDFSKFFRFIVGQDDRTPIGTYPRRPTADACDSENVPAVPRPTGSDNSENKRLGRFAFLIHYTEVDDILLSGPPGFADGDFGPESRARWTEWMQSWSARRFDAGIACHIPVVNSGLGGFVEGWLIASPLMPQQMLRLAPRERASVINDYMAVAQDLGIDMLGLGAFTSIITRNGTDIADRCLGLSVTTGNSLTAIAAAHSLKRAIRDQGRDPSGVDAGIIGAGGTVGRLVSKVLVNECRGLVLFGNPNNPAAMRKLQTVAGELYRDALLSHISGGRSGIGETLLSAVNGKHAVPDGLLARDDAQALMALYRHVETAFKAPGRVAPIRITVDLATYLPFLDAVVSATNQGGAFIDPALFAPGAIVCDVARPPDILKKLARKRPDVLVYEGGLVKFPDDVSFGSRNVIGTPPGVNLGCLAETVVLTMAGVRRNYSMGERPSLGDAWEVFRLATEHGFSVPLPMADGRATLKAPKVDDGITISTTDC